MPNLSRYLHSFETSKSLGVMGYNPVLPVTLLQVAHARAALFTVFLFIPSSLLRSLATKRASVGEDGSERSLLEFAWVSGGCMGVGRVH